MSRTFTLKGNTSSLSAEFYPPIELDSRYDYSIALIGFHTYNSIPNIEEGNNNRFVYGFFGLNTDSNVIAKRTSLRQEILIPEGAYEIGDIEQYIQDKILLFHPIEDQWSEQEPSDDNKDPIFSLKPNNNTLKCEFESIYDIDLTADDSVGSLLGFSQQILPANMLHESSMPVEIVKVKTVRVECNIATGSYYEDKPSHTLYEFSPMVDPGYAIDIEPRNKIFLPINTTKISYINIAIVDQNSKPVNFRGEEIIVRLELRKT